jgi:TrmH family RNA methyltransferase
MLSTNDIKVLASLKQKKYREQEGRFLIEGFHLIEECLNSSFHLEKILLRDNIDLKKVKITGHKLPEIIKLTAAQFKKLQETDNSQGIIGVVKIPEQKTSKKSKGNLIIALDRINDPGNLGTILRTSYWFGAEKVLIGENSADIFNSKTTRSSQGAVFHLNIDLNVKLSEELLIYYQSGYDIYMFTLDSTEYLQDISAKPKSILVFGNEADGIAPLLLKLPFNHVKIKGYSKCESLNVAVTSGIALLHFTNNIKA